MSMKKQVSPWVQVLKNASYKKNWSQEEVANRIGSDPKTISRWEHGERLPSPYFQEKLLDLFGKDELGFLFGSATTKAMQEEKDQRILIRINEEPLTAHNINIIISAFIELHTKYWLIQ